MLDPRPARPTQPALHTQALVCERGERALFAALDLQLHAGDCVWLRGANGSGKTTLLRTLAGLRALAQGDLRLTAPRLYLGHANALKDDLTVAECLRFAASLQGQPCANAELQAALAHFDLARLRTRAVRTLSQGQRRRAALARLALPQAAGCLWLLDEPFDALDPEGVAALVRLIEAHTAGGGAVLFTSHQAVPQLAARELQLEPARG